MSRVRPRNRLSLGRGRISSAGALVTLLAAVACAPAAEPLGELPPVEAAPSGSTRLEPYAPAGALVVAHGGQGSPAERSDGPAEAVERTWTALADDGSLREAAAAGVRVMEDDPRYNAGTGANLRLDGRTIECDAAIMDDEGHFGAVAGLHGTRHPIDAAIAVADGPHLLVAGQGANELAEALGLEQRDLTTDRARAKLRRGWLRLLADEDADRAWSTFDWRAQWNFEGAPPSDMAEVDGRLQGSSSGPASPDAPADAITRDTVGVVARDATGHYVAALSTGGTTLALRGRVGDVPQFGHGLYAGPVGAVAATGKGEAIVRERVAYEVYRRMAEGTPPDEAIRLAVRGISPAEGVGVIAVGEQGWGARATSQMAWAVRSEQGLTRADDVIRTDRW